MVGEMVTGGTDNPLNNIANEAVKDLKRVTPSLMAKVDGSEYHNWKDATIKNVRHNEDKMVENSRER